jgi:hypothetical protein
MITNLLIAAFVAIESGGDWQARNGDALGGLQIRPVMVREYNQATGRRVRHRDVVRPAVAHAILRWYVRWMERKHGRPLTVAEHYRCWNAGPNALERGEGRSIGRRVEALYEAMRKEGNT